jgi:hypothetical protein
MAGDPGYGSALYLDVDDDFQCVNKCVKEVSISNVTRMLTPLDRV